MSKEFGGIQKALVIGVSNYNSNQLDPLDFCRNDGEVFNFLRSRGYEIEEGQKLIGMVEYWKMHDVIIDFFTCTKPKDIVFFYFSGHGVPTKARRCYSTIIRSIYGYNS